ncbi:hypothetical protein N9U05_00580 [bacterium]|nr:hypothetical protein [bacterium]
MVDFPSFLRKGCKFLAKGLKGDKKLRSLELTENRIGQEVLWSGLAKDGIDRGMSEFGRHGFGDGTNDVDWMSDSSGVSDLAAVLGPNAG